MFSLALCPVMGMWYGTGYDNQAGGYIIIMEASEEVRNFINMILPPHKRRS